MKDVAVIYLAWYGAGLSAYSRFIESYRRRRSGRDHTLVVVFKEVPEDQQAQYDALLQEIPHDRVFMPEPCYDIPAYLRVSRTVTAKYVCLLNTNSEILAEDWLLILSSVAEVEIVGAVSATGSWESHLTNTFDSWRNAAAQGHLLLSDRLRSEADQLSRQFSPFPNYHLRTNALIIDRERFLQIPFSWNTESKAECLAFESGWDGLTHHLIRQRLQPVVANSQGNLFLAKDWPASRTFRMNEQEFLLVGDNRTRDYANGDPATRAFLRYLAWGRKD